MQANLAVIMTCHNRRGKTLACLHSLFSITKDVDVYLTVDGCTDGTYEAVTNEFPQVHTILGDGNLFWSRGMYTAWKEAVKKNYDFYLWLNDDIELYDDALEEMFECENALGRNCIISGLIEDKDKVIIYGGSDEHKRLVGTASFPQKIVYMNGNVVLVPKMIVKKIGIIDAKLHHDSGDVDYGLTAIENGFSVVVSRKPVATGTSNNYCRVRKWNSNIIGRFRKLYSPLGCPPPICFYFRRKHFGWIDACMYICYLYIINILPDVVVKRLFGDWYIDK